MSTTLSSESRISKVLETKKRAENAVRAGTRYIFDCMVDGQVPSFRAGTGKFGLWTAAEMVNFLLTNQILPKTCSQKIEPIIDYLIGKFDRDVGAWPVTTNDSTKYYSAMTTGYCTYVLKLYCNEFLEKKRKDDIKDIIERAEKYLVAKQEESGFWTPDSVQNATKSPDGCNYPDFFYSYYAYFGIRPLLQNQSDDSKVDKEQTLRRAKNYFNKYARQLVTSFSTDKVSVNDKTERIAYISKLYQVLSDFDDEALADTKVKLRDVALQIFDDVEGNQFATSSITLDRLSYGQKTFNNNTPFDVYFAFKKDKTFSDNVLKIVDWFIDKKHTDGCWYLDANPSKNICIWTTMEAMMVLSDAYNVLSEQTYSSEMDNVDKMREDLRKQKNAVKKQVEKVKNKDAIWLWALAGVTFLVFVGSLVFFILIRSKGLTQQMVEVINGVIISLTVSVIVLPVSLLIKVISTHVREKKVDKDNSEE